MFKKSGILIEAVLLFVEIPGVNVEHGDEDTDVHNTIGDTDVSVGYNKPRPLSTRGCAVGCSLRPQWPLRPAEDGNSDFDGTDFGNDAGNVGNDYDYFQRWEFEDAEMSYLARDSRSRSHSSSNDRWHLCNCNADRCNTNYWWYWSADTFRHYCSNWGNRNDYCFHWLWPLKVACIHHFCFPRPARK